MDSKTTSTILLVAGLLLLVLSLIADMIGIGGVPGFGYKQILGSVIGAIAATAGFFMMRK